MAIPDNRMRFPAPKIDFENDVGLTGQDHDDYPEPGQPRWDWMRMSIMGLLAQQSSFDEPTQKRPGTPWFNLNTNILKLWNGTQWIKYGDVIEVANDLTLTQFYENIKDQLVEFLVTQEDIQYAVNLIINAALSEYITPLTVVERDGSPSVEDVGTLIFPNGSLIQTGTGKARVRFPVSIPHEIIVAPHNFGVSQMGSHWIVSINSGDTPAKLPSIHIPDDATSYSVELGLIAGGMFSSVVLILDIDAGKVGEAYNTISVVDLNVPVGDLASGIQAVDITEVFSTLGIEPGHHFGVGGVLSNIAGGPGQEFALTYLAVSYQ